MQMKLKQPVWLPCALILIATLSCVLPLSPLQSSSSTSTPKSAGGISGDGTIGGNGTGGSNNGNGSQIHPLNLKPVETPTPTPTPIPTPGSGGPYLVKQIETLGHETISGQVCSVVKPFTVFVTAPSGPFTFNFVPSGTNLGTWTYAYNIASAGEVHNASGKYTINQPAADGTLSLSMSGSDHVTFKGFDGPMAVSYKFDLVPSSNINCPNSQ